MCGSLSGSIVGGLLTPLDVAKTRIMLGKDAHGVPYVHMVDTLQRVYKTGGGRALYAGLPPRMLWYMLGGIVYFGVYGYATNTLERAFEKRREAGA